MNINFALIIQIISFLILLGLLTKYFYRPMMNYLDNRSKEIKDMIQEAQENRRTAEKELDKAQEQLRKTKEQVLQMKTAATKEADEHRRLTVEQAKKEAFALLERAKLEINRELSHAKDDLRGEVGSLSVEIAKRILEREVTEEDNKKLIRDSLKELENA